MLQKTMLFPPPPYLIPVLNRITFRLHKVCKRHSFNSFISKEGNFPPPSNTLVGIFLEHVLLLVDGRHILQIAFSSERYSDRYPSPNVFVFRTPCQTVCAKV